MKKTFIFAIVAAAMLVFGPVLAQACTCDPSVCPGDGTVWVPTESGEVDVNYLTLSDAKFAIFDDTADLAVDPYFLIKTPADTVQFIADGDDWGLKHVDETVPSFYLQDSNQFILAMDNGSGWVAGNAADELAYGIYSVCWPGDCVTKMVQIDAQPVPIPAAVYLLGAGLLGIAGFRKRK